MNLAEIRKQKGMTQETVSELAGIRRASYTNIEQGRRTPSVETAKRIASVLEFDWTCFFEETNRESESKAV